MVHGWEFGELLALSSVLNCELLSVNPDVQTDVFPKLYSTERTSTTTTPTTTTPPVTHHDVVDPLTDITSHGDHSHEEFSKGDSGLNWVFDPDLPMTNTSDKWYTHYQNWQNGIERDHRFANANEFNWITATTEEAKDIHGNKTHRSWVDITNFYWYNRFTKDIYMMYNLPVDNGPIIANNAHLTKMTVLYLAADDWEHGLYTHEMIQRGGYILRLATTHGETLDL
ncbi:Hypothetical predicted protein [Mytilus galloprovincialis]|uniref:Uncharacterized protein n=1 Tax=Mytilus galloprovincialis TaxID=29158 RepID=A0A8B6C7Y6_MYTGA|nr:Hypothetical predicted protein [Mytilus galloprovincialis]